MTWKGYTSSTVLSFMRGDSVGKGYIQCEKSIELERDKVPVALDILKAFFPNSLLKY